MAEADRVLRVATVGCGYFSRFHHEAWLRLPDVALVGVCDVDGARAAEFAARYGAGRSFTDAAAMLEACRPDVLDVVTPPVTHATLVAMAAERGVDVICQKPLAPTLAAARELVATAEAGGIRLVTHENFRFQPWYREIRRLLDAGRLGRVHQLSFRLRPGDGQGPDAYLGRQPYFQRMERFLVHETLIHLIDTFRFLAGEVRAVFAWLRRLNPVIAGEDAGLLVLRFADGAGGLIDGNRLVGHVADDPRRTMGELWVDGEAGVLRLDGAGRIRVQDHLGAEVEHGYAWTDRPPGGDSVLAFQAHAVAHLLHAAPVETAARSYLRNMEIEEAVYRSAAEGRWIEV